MVRIEPLYQHRGTGHPFTYSELRREMVCVELAVAYQGVQVVAGLKCVPDLKLPLTDMKEIQK